MSQDHRYQRIPTTSIFETIGFSHSIGVAYLSEVVLKNLKANQPYLNITPIDILCVKIAGLCHDLGHGAYSHVWEVFMKKVAVKEWHHENSSVEMFQYLITRNQISLAAYGLTAQDELFITEIIRGVKEAQRRGRPKEKFFLYDIVNNSRSGLDVDKLDYFLRDIKHTNVHINSVSFDRFFQLGRVLKAEPIHGSRYRTSSMQLHPPDTPEVWTQQGKSSQEDDNNASNQDYMYTICYPMKMVGEAVNLFSMRFHLHQKVYTHKSVKKVECMLVDAFAKADPYLRIPGSVTADHPDGLYKLSECVFDAGALSNLNDMIIYLIESSIDPNLQPAREVLAKLRDREFYDCLGKSMYRRKSIFDTMTIEQIQSELVAAANKHITKLKEKEAKESQRVATAALNDQTHNVSSLESSFDELVEGSMILPAEEYVFSQDSFPPWLSREPTITSNHNNNYNTDNNHRSDPKIPFDTVELDDIIVEKMHIHYGLKEENPVNRLRFFTKEASEVLSSRWDESLLAMQVKESQYETLLPRVFEELAVRVFCRAKEKSPYVAEAFRSYCREKNELVPFLTLSQPN